MPQSLTTHIDNPEAVAQRLLQARGAAGLSQRQLAFAGCTAAYISRLEAGARVPSGQMIEQLALRLHVNPLWLARGEGRMKVQPTYDTLRMLPITIGDEQIEGVQIWAHFMLFLDNEDDPSFGETLYELANYGVELWDVNARLSAMLFVDPFEGRGVEVTVPARFELPGARLDINIGAKAVTPEEAELLARFAAMQLNGPVAATFCHEFGARLWDFNLERSTT